LDLRLYQLTGLEVDKVKAEYAQILERIKDLMDILAKESRVFTIIKEELREIKAKHATPRLTQTGARRRRDRHRRPDRQRRRHHHHHPHRPDQAHRRQFLSRPAPRRQGRHRHDHPRRLRPPGEDQDFVEHLFTASTHDYLMFFTNTGRVYVERVHEIPDMGRAAKGRSIANLLELKADEKSPP
jgi:DNA gyrase subunit A